VNKIEELIAEFCPDGAEFMRLGDVFTVLRGKRLTKPELDENAEYFVYHGGLNPLGKYSKYNREAETVMVINVGASAGSVGYSRDKFWSSDGCYCLSHSEKMESRFAYYLLLTFQNFFVSQVRRAGIPTLDGNVISTIRIPVPPLEVQKEIVNILDKFTQLEAELSAELEARRRQYEFYRNQLFASGKMTNMVPLNNICEYISSGKNKNKNTYGKYPVYGSTGVIGFTDTYKYTGEVLLAARVGANAGFIQRVDGEYDVSDNTLMIKPRSGAKIDFLYHQLVNMNLNQYAAGGGQPLITGGKLKELMVVAPSVEEQDRIITILDKFDTLVNDISEGLPAEITARRKQYEYYRSKLLTFQELSV
jgi:type I restriction enzyme S subunit